MAIIGAPPRDPRTTRHAGLAVIPAAVIAVLLAAAAVAVLLTSDLNPPGLQVHGNGIAAAQARTVPAFSKLELAGSAEVVVTAGLRQSVVVHADRNLLRHVTTRVTSGMLVIGSTGSFTTRSPMRVVVTVPTLTSAELSGSGTMSITGISTPRLTLTLPGSGVLRASGTAAQLDITLDGSGQALLAGLVAGHVRAILAGSGTIAVTAKTSLFASVTGSGTITYSGNPPQLTTNVTGSGAVTRG
jgi:Putative auto-transporter adhesin, head GIN domain